MARPLDLPGAAIAKHYQAGQSTVTLARRYGCSPTTVAKIIRTQGVEVRPARFRPMFIVESELRDLYVVQRLPVAQIAAYFGVSTSTVGNKRRLYGIAVRARRVAPAAEHHIANLPESRTKNPESSHREKTLVL